MESVITFFAQSGIDFVPFVKIAAILLLGSLLIPLLNRFIFRKPTLIGQSVSSSIAIIFIYVAMALMLTLSTELKFLVTPLPFADITQNSIQFFSFHQAEFTTICAEILSIIILSFLVCLADTWLPKGKNMVAWVFYRVLTVAIGFALHYLVSWLLNQYLPEGLVAYAPVILLGILLLMLLTGALRFLLGLILATVNPLIAAFYTFFFATVVGKQITKSVLTSALLSGLVLLMEKMGITTLSLMTGALVAYIPFLLLLVIIWYISGKL